MLSEDQQYLSFSTPKFYRLWPAWKALRFLSEAQNRLPWNTTPLVWGCKLYSLKWCKAVDLLQGTETMLALQRTPSQATSVVSRQVEFLPPPLKLTIKGDRLDLKRANSCLFNHHPLRDRNGTLAFPYRRIWQSVGTWHWLAGQGPGQSPQSSFISSGTWAVHWSQ